MIETKDGQVFKDGKLIGLVDGDQLFAAEKLHHKVKSAIEKETGLTVIYDAAAGPLPTPHTTKPSSVESIAPPAPEMDPDCGDKTPAYVEWVRDYYPDEFKARYKNRKTHLTEKSTNE